MKLNRMAASAWRWRWTLVVSTCWAALVGYAVASSAPATYKSEVRLQVGPSSGPLVTLRAAGHLTDVYADMAASQPVLDAVASELAGRAEVARLRSSVTVKDDRPNRLLTIAVRDQDPRWAAAAANAVATTLTEFVARGLSAELPNARPTGPEGQVTVIERAVPENDPVAPRVPLIVAMSAAGGLLSAIVLVLLIDVFGGTISNERELAESTSLVLLGTVGRSRSARRRDHCLPVEAAPKSRIAAAYRRVATRIALAGPGVPRSVLVIGTDRGAGPGEVAANLAAALVADGRRVVLVDANQRQAEVTALLGLLHLPGLTELLGPDWTADGASNPKSLLVRRSSGLIVLPAGRGTDEIQIKAIPWLIDRLLASVADTVIVAGLPADGAPKALAWARHSDRTVLVARSNTTRRKDALNAASLVRGAGAALVGAVLLDSRSWPVPSGGRARVSDLAPTEYSAPLESEPAQ